MTQATDDRLWNDAPALPEGVDDGFGHWLAGFLDGEGCFFISARTRKGYVSYTIGAKLALRADDRPIIEEIHRRTGIGRIMAVSETRALRGEQKPQVAWVVSSRGDCRVLRAILDRHPLRAKKARDVEIWKRALDHWGTDGWYVGGNRGPRDWSGLAALAEELRQTRAYA